MGIYGPPSMLYSAEAIVLPPVVVSVTLAVSVNPVPKATRFGVAVELEVMGACVSPSRIAKGENEVTPAQMMLLTVSSETVRSRPADVAGVAKK